jgi:hypothetical protein
MTFTGDVDGNIHVSNLNDGSTFTVGGNLNGNVEAEYWIDTVAVAGDLTGNITSQYLADLEVAGNCSGSIEGGYLGIYQMTVGGNFTGNVTCGYILTNMEITGNFSGTVYSNLVGVFRCDTFVGGIVWGNDLLFASINTFDVRALGTDAPTVFCSGFDTFDIREGDRSSGTGQFYFTSIPADRAVRIGDSLFNCSIIFTEAHGLAGQIILNAQNGASPAFASAAVSYPVSPSFVITAPYYVYHADLLGGGAVGQVPYNLHVSDCDPAQGDSVCEMPTRDWPIDEGTEARETMVPILYGPVFDTRAGTGPIPVKVERQSLLCAMPACPASWEDISTDCSVLAGQGTGGREVWVSYTPSGTAEPFPNFYNYKVTPLSDEDERTYLRSNGTFVSPAPNVHDFTYEFTLVCWENRPLERGGGGEDYLTADLLDSLLGVDMNRDGVVDENDTLELLQRLGLS